MRSDSSQNVERAMKAAGTDRGWEDSYGGNVGYKTLLGCTNEELRRWAGIGWIIDLGSGARQKVARAIQSIDPSIMVLSIDPSLASPDEIKWRNDYVKLRQGTTSKFRAYPSTIASLIEEGGAIAEGVAGAVFAVYSRPYYADTPEEVHRDLNTMISWLAAGGEIRIYPVREWQKDIVQIYLQNRQDVFWEWQSFPPGRDDRLIIRKKVGVS